VSEYKWRKGRSHGANAQAVGEELAALSAESGTLTPDTVLDRASSPASAMHKCFEWDDSKAAQHHRRWQARTLVRAIQVVPKKKAEPQPMFVHTSSDDAGPHYMAASVIVTRPDLLDMAKRHAVSHLRSAKQRVEELKHLADSGEYDEAFTLIESAEGKLSA